MITIARYLMLAGMLATVAWFFWNPNNWTPDWEPIVVFLLSLAGFITSDYQSYRETAADDKGDKFSEADNRLFNELRDLLPSNRVIKFLAEHDFGGSFFRQEIEPLRTFRHDWDNAEHEFINQELEALRLALHDRVGVFLNLIARYTVPIGGQGQSVNPPDSDYGDPERDNRIRRNAEEINNAADDLVQAHQSLIRAFRGR